MSTSDTDLDFFQSNESFSIEMSFSYFCSLINLIPLCWYASKICVSRRGGAMRDELSSKTSMAVELLTTSSMAAFSAALLIRGTYSLLKTINCPNEPLVATLAGCSRLFWAIGTALIHLLFIKRFQYAFKGTAYATSKRVYTVLYTAIFVFVVCNIVVVADHIVHHFVSFSRTNYMQMNLSFTLCYTLIDLLVSVGLVYLFIQKLFIIIVQIDPTLNRKQQQQKQNNTGIASPTLSSVSASTVSSRHSHRNRVRLNNEQSSFLNIITKYFILNAIGIVSNQIAQITGIAAELFYLWRRDNNVYHFIEDIFWVLWISACCINSLCVYLQLDLSQAMYGRVCRRMHVCCALWCNRLAIRKVEQAESNYVILIDNNYAL